MFVEAITIFYKITNSILFSNKSNVLHPDWILHHKLFIEAFLNLGIPRFPKFHITEIHVPEIIKIRVVGLGMFTEIR